MQKLRVGDPRLSERARQRASTVSTGASGLGENNATIHLGWVTGLESSGENAMAVSDHVQSMLCIVLY